MVPLMKYRSPAAGAAGNVDPKAKVVVLLPRTTAVTPAKAAVVLPTKVTVLPI
jgi:hypothetical protein